VRRTALITSLLFLALTPTARAWTQRVPLPKAHGAAAGPTTTKPLRTAHGFDLVGVQWRGRATVKIDLRARSLSGGRWSRWAPAGADGDGPDPAEAKAARAALNTGEPLWAGRSDAVQLRLSRPVTGLRLRLIDTGKAATARAARQPATLPLPATNAAAPAIVPRSSWDPSGRCRPTISTPGFGNVQMAFVHHTVSLNGYSRSQSAAVVLGVCLYHRDGRGWHDIGYNFLVDRYGQVFEGRAGGIDQPVVGAQAGGFNVPSTGVSMIGDFTRTAPPKVAMDALARLLAWKLSIHGVPATGHTTVTSAGGPSTAYRAGTRVTLPRISGHRDADLTACPGAALYRQLPALRTRVAKLEGDVSSLSLAASASTVPYGTGLTVAGTLSPASGGEPVEIRALAEGRERVVASALTAPDGSWSSQMPAPARSSLVRAVYMGGASPGTISNLARVEVTPVISLGAEQPGTGSVVVDGTVAPGRKAVTVTAYRGRQKVSTRRIAVRDGSFRGAIGLPAAGTYRLVATVPADAATGAARSHSVEVQSG
jgi:hypothetical protein